MSVESLVCEVRPLLSVSLALRAADELFFGDSILYNKVANVATTSGEPAQHAAQKEKKKKDKKEKKHRNAGDAEAHVRKDSGKADAGSGRQATRDPLKTAIDEARQTVQKALDGDSGEHQEPATVMDAIKALRKEHELFREDIKKIKAVCDELKAQYFSLKAKAEQPLAEKEVKEPKKEQAKEDEDFDLFGSSDEELDEEKERIKQERLKAYEAKKAKKPASIAKSSVILDVKPWDDETNMEKMEQEVRAIEKDGLVWGGGKLIPLAYGIRKLQIICVIEDEKVSVDDLIDNITENIADYVQSVDIVAFNKI